MGAALRILAVAVLVTGAAVGKHLKDEGSESKPPPIDVVTCQDATAGRTGDPGRTDVVMGPLTLVGGKAWSEQDANAFSNNGFKIPVVLDAKQTVKLAAARSARPNVRFAYTHKTAEAAGRKGVGGAPYAVRFDSCDGRRSGFPGGVVIRHRGCYGVVLRQTGEAPIRRRLPLGREC